MKILMLADTMDIGGAETHIYELSRSLFSMGHKIKIFSGGGRTAKQLGESAEVVQTDEAVLPHSLFHSLLGLLRLLREFKPDVVHAHTRRGLFLANAAKSIIPFPLVFTAHAKFSASLPKRFFTRPPAFTIAVSEDIKRHFGASFLAKNITVIPNGIDTRRFSSAKPDQSRLRIVTVSRLDRDCSVSAELLCRIAPALLRRYPGTEILIVGGGNNLGHVMGLAQKANASLGREVIKCVGAQSDVLPFLRVSNIFVGVSRAALEAMSCGMPTVICGNEGFFGLCRQSSFDICSKGNFCARDCASPSADRLLNHIIKAAENLGDPDLDLSGKVKESFSIEGAVIKTLSVYQKAIGDYRARQKYDVTLCGYYGFGNLGDELVLKRISQGLDGYRIAVIGTGEKMVSRLDLLGVLHAIRYSRLFLLGGGSLLQNSTSRRSLGYYLALLGTADFFGRRVMLYANGLGPIDGKYAAKACAKALRRVDVASFRDEASLKLARSMFSPKTELYLSCDPALDLISPKTAVKRIALFVRGEDISSRLTKILSQILADFAGTHEICFASMNSSEDEKTARGLAKNMPFAASCRIFRDVDELTEFIAASEVVVSSRLHALVIAASTSRPFVALCGDPKLEAFVHECRLEKLFALRLDDMALSAKLKTALTKAVTRENELSDSLKKAIPHLAARKAKDFEKVRELLK